MEVRKITSEDIRRYRNEVLKNSSASTFDRKIFSLKKFFDWAVKEGFVDESPVEEFLKAEEEIIETKLGKIEKQKKAVTPSYTSPQARIIAKLAGIPRLQKLAYHLFYTRPKWYISYHSLPIANYFNLAILIILMSGLGFGVYNQFFKTTATPMAYPTALTRAGRYLSFQGRLTNTVGNPITTSRNFVFKLYNVETGGTALWDSGTCAITPDADGIFSTLLGSSCGTEIPASVFSENSAIWLGVTVGTDAEATPRVQIATVAYALNAETLQGFPASMSATANTIPAINSSGFLVLGSASPKIQSTSGTFAIEGQAMTISTPNTSNGSIAINPDGTGTLNLIFEGATPGGSAGGFVNATNANITSGALYYGSVASGATGYNLLQLQSGATPTNKFLVDYAGNITASGTINGLTVSGGTISSGTWNGTAISTTYGGTGQNWSAVAQGSIPYFSGTGVMSTLAPGTSGYVLTTQGTGANPVWTDAGSVGTNYWALGSGTIYPGNTTLDLLIGNSATASAKFAFKNVLTGTPTASISGTTNVATFIDGNGNISTTNRNNLVLGNSSTYDSTGNILLNPNGTGNVGIGTTAPSEKLSVSGTISASGLSYLNNVVIGQINTLPSNDARAYMGWLNVSGHVAGSLGLFARSSEAADISFYTGYTTTLERMRINSSGNVGIGTTFPTGAPVDKLTVAGGNATIYNTASLGSEKVTNGTFADSSIWTWGTGWAHDATNLEADHTAGNIVALEQNVSAVTGEIYQVVFTVKNRTVGSVTPQVGGVNGAAVSSNTTSTQQIRATGTGNLMFIPTSDFNGSIDDVSVKLITGGDIKLAGLLTGGGTSGIKVLANGNVGIGTTSPGYKLDVNGDIRIASGSDLYIGTYGLNDNASANSGASLVGLYDNAMTYIAANTTVQGAIKELDTAIGTVSGSAGGWTDDGTIVRLTTSSDSVGIGTTAPTAKLDIAGTASSSGTLAFRGTTDPKIDILNGENFGIRTSVGGDAGLTERLTVLNNGNVGIGTNAPSKKLDIRNDGDASIKLAKTDGDQTLILTGGNGGTGSITAQRSLEISALSGNLLLSPSGNVGIGTTTPTAKLDVNGNLNVSGYATASASLALGNTSAAAGPGHLNMSGNLTVNGTLNGLTVSSGTITGGTWNGTAIGTQYGGTGQNWSAVAQGSIPYFSGTGIMSTLAPGTSGYVLTTQGTGANPVWTDAASVGTNYWALGAGTIYPGNTTLDLLLGSSATSSAKFAFTGVAGGTPTASISGTTNVATFIDGNGNISTTNRNNLVLGNSSTYDSTGNILLNPSGTGNVGIGVSSPNTSLEVNGLIRATRPGVAGQYVQFFGGDSSFTAPIISGVSLGSNMKGLYISSLYTGTPTAGNNNIYFGSGQVTPPTWTSGTIYMTLLGSTDPNPGRLGIGSTTPTAKLDIAGDASTSASLVFRSATPTIDMLNGSTLTFQSSPGGDTGLTSIATLTPSGNLTVNGTINGLTVSSGTISSGTWQGTAISTTYGGTGQNWSTVAQGSIPYFSGTGIMSTLAPGTSGYVLTTQGTSANPTWTNAASVGTNYWALGTGTIYPGNTTLDLLIGNSATTSAKFAFKNVLTGTPTASISGTTNVATFIDGNGNISTTNRNNLVLGNSSTYNSTGNILLNPNGTGNVGIGVTSPIGRLNIAGTTSNYPGQTIIRDDGAYLPTFEQYKWSGSETNYGASRILTSTYTTISILRFQLANTITTIGSHTFTDIMAVTSAGNVGIGTTNPQRQLEISGSNPYLRISDSRDLSTTGEINGIEFFSADPSGSSANSVRAKISAVSESAWGSSHGLAFYTKTDIAGDPIERVRITSDGNVGIGTTSPTAKLDVNGNLNVSGYATASASLALGNTSAAAGPGHLNMSGNLTAGGTINGLTVSSGTITSGTWNAGLIGAQWGGTGANNSTAAQYSIPYYSTAGVLGGILTPGTSGYVLSTNSTGGAPTWIAMSAAGINHWQLNSNVLAPINISNDLAIGGNATASAKFMINGATGNASSSGTLTFRGTTDPKINILNGENFGIQTSVGGDTGLTERLTVLNNGNVGIGTTAPATKLEIVGQISASAGSTSAPTYSFVNDLDTGIYSAGADQLAFSTGNNLRALFDTSGIRVGGSLYSLDYGSESMFIIEGSENAPTAGTPIASLGFSNDSNQASQTSDPIAKILVTTQDSTANQGRLHFQTKDGSTLSTRLIIDKNGLVGINTTSPLSRLSVVGTATNAIGKAAFLVDQYESQDILTASASGQTKLTLTNTGNLTVTGTINGLTVSSGIITSGTWQGTAISTTYGGTGQNWSAVAQGSIPYFSGTGTMSTLAPGTTGWVLTTQGTGANPTWTDAGSVGTNYWQLNSLVLSPANAVAYDLTIGGNATGSAFQVFAATGNITTAGDLAVNGDNISADGTLGILGATGLNLQATTGTINIDSLAATQIINMGASNVDRTINIGTGTGVDTIHIGDGATGADVITIGSANAGAVTVRSNAALTLHGEVNSIIDFVNFDVDTSGNVVAAGTIDINGVGTNDIAGTLNLSGNTLTSTGDLTINPTGGDVFLGASDNLVLTSAGNLFLDTDTALSDTGLNDAGAYLVGAYDDFSYSSSTNVQGVLKDLDTAIGGAGTNHWQLNSNVLAPINISNDLAIGGNATASAKFMINGATGNIYTANNTIDWTLNNAVDALNIDSNTLSIDALNNRVGVGTVSPSAPLTLQGSNSEATLGSEQVTNGNFSTDPSLNWTYTTWTWDATNYEMDYAGSGGAVEAVSINHGGTGYTVNNVLTLSGGGNNATLIVTSVSSGVITGVSITAGGTGYSHTSYSTTGGTGSGANFQVTDVADGSTLSQNVSVSASQTYQVVFTIKNESGYGKMKVSLGGVTAAAVEDNQTAYTVMITTTGTGNLIFTPTADFSGSIDDVSVKQVTQTVNSLATLNNSNGTTGLEIRSGGNSNYGVAIGYQSLNKNTTGDYNTAIGYYSLYSNTTGSSNNALGYASLYSNTTGNYNNALGYTSLYYNTTGSNNNALGYASLYSNTTGSSNNALGYASLYYNTTGSFNNALGHYSLYSNTKGGYNNALGLQSLYSNTTGSFNNALGYLSLRYNTTGNYNNALGYTSLYYNTTGNNNNSLGSTSLFYNTTGSANNALGSASLNYNTTGSYNNALGYTSLYSNTTGSYNNALGLQSLYFNTTGSQNNALGSYAGYYSQTGSNNLFIGYRSGGYGAGSVFTGADYNTIIGYQAGYNLGADDDYNVYLGYQAGYSETGSNKLYIAKGSNSALIYGDFSTGTLGLGGTTANTNPYMYINSTGNVGINTTSPLSRLSVVGTATNAIGKAAFLVDQYESQDILTASASGQTKMTLKNDGTLSLYNATSTISNTSGDITINAASNLIAFSGDSLGNINNITAAGVLNAGGKSGVAYNTFAGASDTPASSAMTSSNDLFVGGDTELKGGLYLTGRNIFNTVGGVSTGTIMLASDPTLINSYNALSYGSWLVNNSTNNGLAALMVNQSKGGDIFTASVSGSPKMTLTNAGNLGIGTTSPGATLDVAKTVAATSDVIGSRVSLTQSASGALTAIGNRIILNAAHTSGTLQGSQANSTQLYFAGSGGTTNYAEGVTSWASVSSGAIVSNLSLMKIFNPSNSGTITNLKGLHISNMSEGSTSNYSIYSEGGTMYHAGNVGIGTTSPAQKLQVAGSIAAETSATNGVSTTVTGGNAMSIASFSNTDATTYGYGTRIRYGGSGTNASIFAIVGVGDTVSAYFNGSTVNFPGTIQRNGTNYVSFNSSVNGRTKIADTGCGSGWASSCDAGNNGWPDYADALTSDIRLKTVTKPLTNVMGKIMQLKPTYYEWNENYNALGLPNRGQELGFIAQDVQQLFPELVFNAGPNDPYYHLDYQKMTAVLAAGIQEQQTQISSLSAQLADLALTSSGDLHISTDSNGTYQVMDTTSNTVITKIGALAEAIAANIKAGAIVTKELTTDSFLAFQGTVDNMLVKSGLVSPIVQTALISPLPNQTDVTMQIGKRQEVNGESEPGKFAIQNADKKEVASIDSSGNATFEGTVNSEQLTVNGAVNSEQLTVNGAVNSEQLTVNSEATIAGTLYADNIKSKSLDEIKDILAKVETDQALLAQAADWSVDTASSAANLSTTYELLTTNLYVTDQAAMNSLSLSQSLSVGTDMIIQALGTSGLGNSIDTLTSPLRIQSLAMAPIEIMAGLIKIDTAGNMIISGNLAVGGKIESAGLSLQESLQEENLQATASALLTLQNASGASVAMVDASGSALFRDITTQGLTIAGAVDATASAVVDGVITTNATAGSGIIPAYTSEITIKNPNVTNYTLVYVTPTSSTENYVLYVKSKKDGEFVVGFTNSLEIDVSFNWWVVRISQ